MFNLKWVFVLQVLSVLICLNTPVSSSDPPLQQQLDKVQGLPGQNFNVSFAHYSGYVTVNEESGRALFYWFFEAAEDPSSKPIVLWLNGGQASSPLHLRSYFVCFCTDFLLLDCWMDGFRLFFVNLCL